MCHTKDTFITVTLVNGHPIKIVPQSAEVGGCWQARDNNGHPCVWDPPMLELVLDILNRSGADPYLVDIGANTGYCALLPAINPRIKAIAFEPNLEIFSLLKMNIEANDLQENVHAYPIALSDKPGTATLKVPASGVDSGLACTGLPLRFAQWKELSIPMDTLDRVLSRKKPPRIDLIKIDTEGGELPVLKGAINTIKEFKPHIICEYWAPNTAQFGYQPQEITSFLANLGYSSYQIGKEDMLFVYSN